MIKWPRRKTAKPAEPTKPEVRADFQVYKIGGGWGHHISWSNAENRRVYGHLGIHPRTGDILHAEMGSGKTAVMVFGEIEPQWDPEDMFFAQVWDIGYLQDFPEYLNSQPSTDRRPRLLH